MTEGGSIDGKKRLDVDLFWAEISEMVSEKEASVRAMMSPAERQRFQNFGHEPSRRCFLVTRRLVRRRLSEIGGREPEDWRFETGDYGRPRLANPTANVEELDFNIAHSRRKVVLAVAFDGRVGVDLEPVGRSVDHELVARKFFHPRERAAIEKLDEARRHRRFLQLWVLKEAWMKADGRGIGAGLDEVVFEFGKDDRPRLVRLPEGEIDDWQIRLRICDDHLLAVARRR